MPEDPLRPSREPHSREDLILAGLAQVRADLVRHHGEIRGEIEKLAQGQRALDARLDQIEIRLERGAGKLDEHERAIQTLDGWRNAHEATHQALHARLTQWALAAVLALLTGLLTMAASTGHWPWK